VKYAREHTAHSGSWGSDHEHKCQNNIYKRDVAADDTCVPVVLFWFCSCESSLQDFLTGRPSSGVDYSCGTNTRPLSPCQM